MAFLHGSRMEHEQHYRKMGHPLTPQTRILNYDNN